LAFFHKLLGIAPERIALFPEWGLVPYAAGPPPVEVVGARMRVLDHLQSAGSGGGSGIVVASLPAFQQRLLPRTIFRERSFSLATGESIARTDFITRLLRLGYEQVSAVENPGEFAIRGGIADVFSTAGLEPHRIEFLGDTIETLRPFDPSTQKSSGRARALRVLPAREFIVEETAAPLP